MKKGLKLITVLTLILSLVCTTLCFAEESYEGVTLVFSASDCISATELEKPQEEWTIIKLLKQFEEEHPGLKVEFDYMTDTNAAHATYKASVTAGTAPDVANLWSGMNILSFKDALLCLNDYIPEEDKPLFENANACKEGLTPDGDIYAYPFISKNAGFFLYNKKIIAEAGLDFENNPPLTLDDFYAACDAIKEAGYTPIWEDNNNTQVFFYGVGLWWQQGTPAEQIIAEGKGEAKFVDDDGLRTAMETYHGLWEKGYINENVLSETDKMTAFLNGKAAIIGGGTWNIADCEAAMGEDFGVMHFPDISEDAIISDTSVGGIGETLVVSACSEHPELAVELCSFLSTKEASMEILKSMGGNPIRSDITAEELGWTGDPVMEKVFKWNNTQQFSFPPAVAGTTAVGVISGLTNKVLVGEMTVDEFLQKLDDEIAASM